MKASDRGSGANALAVVAVIVLLVVDFGKVTYEGPQRTWRSPAAETLNKSKESRATSVVRALGRGSDLPRDSRFFCPET